MSLKAASRGRIQPDPGRISWRVGVHEGQQWGVHLLGELLVAPAQVARIRIAELPPQRLHRRRGAVLWRRDVWLCIHRNA